MKRYGNLFHCIYDFDNMLVAFHKASKGKRERMEVAEFQRNLHDVVYRICGEIKDGEYSFGKYRDFLIKDPKTRLIQVAPFEQRVVHHAIMNVTAPCFERGLVFDSYACRKGKGQHKAIERVSNLIKNSSFYLKMDIEKFYDSINHRCMMLQLERLFKDRELLSLFNKLLRSYEKTDGCGLPIGNLTSQYLGNYYLSAFDHYVSALSGVNGYVRYMDDMIVFGEHKDLLNVQKLSRCFLRDNFSLAVKHGGELNHCERGIPFLGLVIYPDKMRLQSGCVKRFRKRFHRLEKMYVKEILDEHELSVRMTALFNWNSQFNGLRKQMIEKTRFRDA